MAEHAGLIPIGQAARLLMISEERIRQLVKQGFIPKPEKRGFVQLVGAVQGYLRYLKDDERRSAKSAADSRVRDARALEIELRIAERSRELIPVEDDREGPAGLSRLHRHADGSDGSACHQHHADRHDSLRAGCSCRGRRRRHAEVGL